MIGDVIVMLGSLFAVGILLWWVMVG